MKLPRGVSGARLLRALEHLGYTAVRQKGSDVRLRHDGPPPHSIPLKAGTLHSIVADVARTRSIAVESIIDLLWRER